MIVKVYWMIWGFIFLATAGLFLAGLFTNLTAVVIGFVFFGMVFMGMMSVLPTMVAHPSSSKKPKEKIIPEAIESKYLSNSVPVH